MSNELYNYIDSIWKSISRLKILKKKKTKYFIKDGMINFSLDLLNDTHCVMCKSKINDCSLKKCHHIYYLLIKIYKLNIEDLTFIFKNNNIKNICNKKFLIEDEDKSCPICLEDCLENRINYNSLYQCLNCSQLFHKKCLKKYHSEKCPMCQNNI